LFIVGSLLASTSSLGQASAEVHPYLTHRFAVDLGVFFPDRKLRMSAQGSTGANPGTLVDFNQELGLSESDQTFSLDFGWRFGERWSLLGQYFDSSGGSSWQLEEDIEWEDAIFEQGSGISVGSDFTLTRFFFGRRFGDSVRTEYGIGGGFHWLRIGAHLQGTAIVNGEVIADHVQAESVEGPLPNVGVFYKYSFTPNLAFRGRLDWLDADVGRYDGRMTNMSFGLNYRFAEYFGVGVSYNHFELDVKIDHSDWRGRVDLIYEGAFVYVSAFW
jgi:hypothetical protein